MVEFYDYLGAVTPINQEATVVTTDLEKRGCRG